MVLVAGCDLFLNAGNQAPIARIEVSARSGESPLRVTFNASTSTDPDGEITAYHWSFGDGATATGVAAEHTFISQTTRTNFTVQLRVVDDGGKTGEAQQTIEVRPPGEGNGGGDGEAPTATFTYDPILGMAPLTVQFDAAGSTGGGGSITAYNWDFGDGETGEGNRPLHTFRPTNTRTYTVTLFVWNENNDVGTMQAEVIVIFPDPGGSGEDPVAEATIEDPILLFDSEGGDLPTLYEVTFDGRGSSADAGQRIEYYLWEFGDGEFIINTTDEKVTHVYELESTVHTFRASLTVFDDQGLEDTDQINVTLEQP
jgi:PKD repeat protein